MSILFFEFPSDIWGTVSDWTMIVVTSITATFLYKTLKSQKEVQHAQNKLLQIEQVRLREDFKPLLKYSRFEDGFTLKKEAGDHLISIAVRNVSDNHALNVRPIYTDERAKAIAFKPNPDNLINGEEYMCLYFIVQSLSKNSFKYHFSFEMSYEDVPGTKYKQGVFCRKYDDNEEVMAFMPEIIS